MTDIFEVLLVIGIIVVLVLWIIVKYVGFGINFYDHDQEIEKYCKNDIDITAKMIEEYRKGEK